VLRGEYREECSGADECRPGPHIYRRCEISGEREPRSSKPSGQREGTVAKKRQTAAVSKEPGRQDPDNIGQELAELRRLRQSLVQVAQEILATFGGDPEATEGPTFGPGARGMRRPGMMGRRMMGGRRAYRQGPGPMRGMPPPGRRGSPGMEGPFPPRRRGAAPADEDDTDG
jgi:hypothetical protein